MAKMKAPIVKTYKGSPQKAQEMFLKDRQKMAKKGYFPVSENFIPGAWTGGQFLLGLLLCLMLIGIILMIYMVIVKPKGQLVVTYEQKALESS